jgi:polyhydroxyalkanoic acid synthase PhaR subunit
MQMMRDAYAQGIERWSTAMEEIVGSEDFAAASGQLLALYAQQQQSLRAASRVAAESMQMPTTEDLAEVAQLVINVERKVDEVTDQAAGILTRLAAIEEAISQLAARTEPAPKAPVAKGPTAPKATRTRRTPDADG